MPKTKPTLAQPVYIIDGLRTPQLKARGKPGPFSASDLAVQAGRALLARQPFLPVDLSEVITGCIMPSPDEANIGRLIALRLGCGNAMPAYTVQRNCGSGMQAVDNAAQEIANGRSDLVLAGGTEAMSRAPLLFNPQMTAWFAAWNSAKEITAKAKVLTQFRLGYLAPVVALIRGLSDPLVGLSMGQTAEKLAYRFGITREQMDEFALTSHQHLAKAYDEGYMAQEITPIYDQYGHYYMEDDGLRRDSSLAKLASLPPFFDKPFGLVTAGNSSQVTDGATSLLLASAAAVKHYQLPVLARIVDVAWAGVDPAEMGLGPVHAIAALLQKQGLKLADINYWEINEAFAAQVLACLKAMEDENYCHQYLGLKTPLGHLNKARLNIDGGAIAMGHPVGTSGARITLHLCHVLKRKGAQHGIASMCIGGGQGGAMLIENVSEVQ